MENEHEPKCHDALRLDKKAAMARFTCWLVCRRRVCFFSRLPCAMPEFLTHGRHWWRDKNCLHKTASFTLTPGDAENARPENDGQRKLWVWKCKTGKWRTKFQETVSTITGSGKCRSTSLVEFNLPIQCTSKKLYNAIHFKVAQAWAVRCVVHLMIWLCVSIFDVYLANYRKTLFKLD